MIWIPLLYYTSLFFYFFYRRRSWGIDLAATSLLIAISFFSILIDIYDLYGEYGCNEDHITIPTLLLFCLQWTIVLLPLHHISCLDFEVHPPLKTKLLYGLAIAIGLSSFFILASSIGMIRDALIMDMADVRLEHYKDMEMGTDATGGPLMILPNILTTIPFPTLALFLWFYMKTFTKTPFLLRISMLIASVLQAIIAITIAGRAAMIYWIFEFFLIYSFFYRYIALRTKLLINIASGVIGGLIAILFINITISRFDQGNSTPLASLYGYAGQHINNFCTMIIEGGDTPLTTDRIFPLFTKITTGETFDMYEHYQTLESSTNVIVNVFDTFGGELYLDLGWFGYLFFLVLVFILYIIIKANCTSLQFHHTFPIVVFITFFSHGLFAWPFNYHTMTYAIIVMVLLFFLFKYEYRT